MSSEIRISIIADDQASSAVAAASEKMSSSLDNVAAVQGEVNNAVTASSGPLSEAEALELKNTEASLQLQQAQTTLKGAQDSLNSAIKEYGASSTEAASALRNLNAAQDGVTVAQGNMGQAVQESTASSKQFALGMSGVATASFGLYNAYDRVNQSEISLDRANLMVKTSNKAVEDAELSLTKAVQDHGPASDEAKKAEESLSIARDRLQLSTERQDEAENNVNKTMMSTALMVIPTAITMVDSLSRAWNNMPDITGLLTQMSTKIAATGISASTAAIGVGAFVGGFALGYLIISQFGDALGPVGRAVMAVVPAIIAAAAAVWMLQEGITLGVATVALVAAGLAVGAMVANLSGYGNALGLAEGGVLTKKTLVYAGEAGPEIYMPLSQYEAQRTKDQAAAGSNSPTQIVNIDLGGMHFYGDIADASFLDKAADETSNRLSDALYRRIGQ